MSRGSGGNFETVKFKRQPHPDYVPYRSWREHWDALYPLILVGLGIACSCFLLDAIFGSIFFGGN
jgi:hypothetical protein